MSFIKFKDYQLVREKLKVPIAISHIHRLKIPGATWYPNTINPMLALRVIRANEWWSEFWTDLIEKKLA